jgi:alpha,alpha-trehalase
MRQKNNKTPLDLFPILFRDAQRASVFKDSKTFADAIPKNKIPRINKLYSLEKEKPDFHFEKFLRENFEIPIERKEKPLKEKSLLKHLHQLWKLLKRKDFDKKGMGSLLPLPFPYIVPGGRFNEIYYWDSYFTMMGLILSGKKKWAKSMLNNFEFLIETYGHIPNGNRSYYLSRSQPPFFALMVDLLAKNSSNETKLLLDYRKSLLKEYQFWMKGSSDLEYEKIALLRVVRVEGSTVLNRYWDNRPEPRQESYREDFENSEKYSGDKTEYFLNTKAACESGWDFSSRWFSENNTLNSIQTTDILPLDLNCLLAFYENTLAKIAHIRGEKEKFIHFSTLYEKRKNAINTYFWEEEGEYYTDWNWKEQKTTKSKNLSMVFPLWLQLAPEEKAKKTEKILRKEFLCYGGLRTTTVQSGEQWDAPNGWAPLQWIAIQGLIHYKAQDLARTIALRWLHLNEKVFKETGKMMEKYNVEDENCLAGGGEYPLQDGFGWTNGVYLALKQLYGGERFQRL